MDIQIRRITDTTAKAYGMHDQCAKQALEATTMAEAKDLFKHCGKSRAAHHLITHGVPMGRAHNTVDQWQRDLDNQIALANADSQLDACYSRLKTA